MDRRIKVLMAVHKLSVGNGGPPTYQEIKDALSISSKSVVAADIESLAEDRLLTKKSGRARSLRVTDKGLRRIALHLLPRGQHWALYHERCPGCGERANWSGGRLICLGDHNGTEIQIDWLLAVKRAHEANYEIGGEQ